MTTLTRSKLFAGVTAGGLATLALGTALLVGKSLHQAEAGTIPTLQTTADVGRAIAIVAVGADPPQSQRNQLPVGAEHQRPATARSLEFDEYEPGDWGTAPRSANETMIASTLLEKTEVAFAETPMNECLEFLSETHRIEFWIDSKTLSDANIPPDQPLNLTKSGLQLKTVLNVLLDPLGLTYVIKNEMLVITTRENAEVALETRVYDVSRLTDQIPATQLLELVMTVATARKWKEVDGAGGDIRATRTLLIIRQSYHGHEEIAGLLNQLDHRLTRNRTTAGGSGRQPPFKIMPLLRPSDVQLSHRRSVVREE